MLSFDRHTELRLVRWALHGLFAIALFAVVWTVQSVWLAKMDGEGMKAAEETNWIRKRMRQTDEITKEHQTMVTMMNALQNRADSIRARIPDRPNEGQFLEQTTSAAQQAGIQVKEYRRGKIMFDGDHSQLKVHISLLGPFENICNYVDRLESLPRISRISEMRIKAAKSSNVYPVDLTLTLFFRTDTPDERVARNSQ